MWEADIWQNSSRYDTCYQQSNTAFGAENKLANRMNSKPSAR